LTLAGSAESATLDWSAPDGCPSREAIEARLTEAIGSPLAQATPLRFTARLSRPGPVAYRLELLALLPDEDSRREAPRVFEAQGCSELADAAIVAIALALGIDLTAPRESTDAVQPPVAPAAPASPPVSAVVAPRASSKAVTTSSKPTKSEVTSTDAFQAWLRSLKASARFGLVVDAGALPSIAPGMEVSAMAHHGSNALRVTGFSLLERERLVDGDAGGRFSLAGGSLSVCRERHYRGAFASFCAGLELGKLTGRGIGALRVAHERSIFWALPEADVSVTSPAIGFGLRSFVTLGVGVPLNRTPFVLDGTRELHRPATLVGRLVVGLEIDLN
jgi:hypothetical protein